MNFFEKFKKSSKIQTAIFLLAINLIVNISSQLIKADPSPYRWTWNVIIILLIGCLFFQVAIATTAEEADKNEAIVLITIVANIGCAILLFNVFF